MQSADCSSLPKGTEVKSFSQHIADQTELVKLLQPYDVIIAMRERTPFPAQVIDALPNLRLLVSTGARNASIDSAACERRKIALSGSHGTKSAQSSTSEVAWGLILALAKRLPQCEKAMRSGSGGWQEHVMTESLAGKTLGVLGLGRLGQFVAKYGQSFGMNVIAWSPNLTDERAAAVAVRRVAKEALFKESDFISVHMVLSKTTRGIVGAAELALMKPTAYIINTSRGPLIDEQPLIDVLQNKKIAGAGLDVFWTEPLQKDHVLRSLDNAVLTPHVGYVVDDNMKMFYVNALKNIKAWMAGEPLTSMR
jgi:phosphoglycerate dehydrogenase-like enzyme